jgi:hypothetical protein
MALLLVGTFWLLFPNKGLFFAAFKVFVWLMFGPHLMLLDVFLIRKYYRTKEQLFKDGLPTSTEAMKEEIAQRPNIMEPLLTSSWLRQMVKSGRVVAEHSIKLRDFRKEKYGKFSERMLPYCFDFASCLLFDLRTSPHVIIQTFFPLWCYRHSLPAKYTSKYPIVLLLRTTLCK